MRRLVNQLKTAVVAKNTVHCIVLGLLFANVALLTWYIFYGYQSSFYKVQLIKFINYEGASYYEITQKQNAFVLLTASLAGISILALLAVYIEFTKLKYYLIDILYFSMMRIAANCVNGSINLKNPVCVYDP